MEARIYKTAKKRAQKYREYARAKREINKGPASISRHFENSLFDPNASSLEDEIPILQVITARINTGPAHKMIVWGRYYDDDGALKAVDAMQLTSRADKLYPSDCFLESNTDIHKTIHKSKIARIDSKLDTASLYYIPNNPDLIVNHERALDKLYIPDILLRRAHALLYSKIIQKACIPEDEQPYARLGIVFDRCNVNDINNEIYTPGRSRQC